ncbi:MAG: hypothetical protein HRU32_12915 [Rhodobacteraceae bacterium]|nr:hypothetical protein [Paracoccaceae bacterium]
MLRAITGCKAAIPPDFIRIFTADTSALRLKGHCYACIQSGGICISRYDVLEAESSVVTGYWEPVTVDGKDSLLCDALRSYYGSVPEGESLSYHFTTDETGTYSLALHSGRMKSAMNPSDRYENGVDGAERGDTGNDVYVSLIDTATGDVLKTPTKLYTGLGSADEELRWGVKFDDSTGHYDAELTLEAGKEYELVLTGRSDGYVLNKITLNKDTPLRDPDAAESELVVPEEESAEETPTLIAAATNTSEPSGGGDSIFEKFFGIFENLFDALASLFGGGGSGAPAPQPAAAAQTETASLEDVLSITGTYDETLPDGDFDANADDVEAVF